MTPAVDKAVHKALQKAVLVIDVQQGLCAGKYAAHNAVALIERINTIAKRARTASCPVFFIQHDEPGGPLELGSTGWQLAEGLHVHAADHLLEKQASDSFHNTSLQTQLQTLGVTQLIVCGLQTEYCIDTTVRRAMALGYPVTLVADGHSTLNSEVLSAPQIIAHHNLTLGYLSSFGPRTTAVNADQVVF